MVARTPVLRCSSNVSNGVDPHLQHSKLPTMHFQDSLPRLPVPKLSDTCERYLRMQKVVLDDQEFQQTEKIVKEFSKPDGQGEELQSRLVEGNKLNKHTSYITGPWFDMYLESRLPLPLNYNPYMAFRPDPVLNNMVDRATNIIMNAVRFRHSLRASVLEPDVFHLNPEKSDNQRFRTLTRLAPRAFSWYAAYMFNAFPLDMSQYSRLLNSTRIPRMGKDELVTFDSGGNHVVVLHRGNMHKVPVAGEDGVVFSPEKIKASLQHVVDNPRPVPESPVGYLTSTDRDRWAGLREEMVKDPINRQSLHEVDSALFLVCLDSEEPSTREGFSHQMLHGDCTNRWFDKSFSLIFTPSGHAALNFEHAWGDGVAVLRFFNEMYKETTENPIKVDPSKLAGVEPADSLLQFNLSDKVKKEISLIKNEYQKVTSSLDVNLLEYNKFGKAFVKSKKLSPDGIMQLSFQMAFYRTFKYFPATYESCSTAAFKHGRTETLRSGTLEGKACVLAFEPDSGSDTSARWKLMEEASAMHNELTKKAAMGLGFDRHLFALRKLAEKSGVDVPLFQDPAYAQANHIILSTSTLNAPGVLIGAFAPVVPDGFGVGYHIDDDNVGVHLTSYPDRDPKGFIENVEKSLNDMFATLSDKK